MEELPGTPDGHKKWHEIAELLKKNRSAHTIKSICESYGLAKSYVEAIVEHLVANKLIFESAPPPKGPTVAKPSISDTQIKEIFRILRVNGQTPQVRAKVAKQYGIAESLVVGLGKIITEGAPPARTVTESGSSGDSVRSSKEVRQSYLAEGLHERVTLAESRDSLADCSLQELESLGAAYFPR